jgi:hypothetical protein
MADFIPRQDSEFHNWVKQYSQYVDAHFAELGLTVAQNTALQTLLTEWNTNYPAHTAAQAAAQAAAQLKITTRENFEAKVRELTGIIQSNSEVTNEQRAELGITIPKDTHTPVPVPTTRPMGSINNVNRLEHIITFFDESTPNSKAKPFGVMGCEIWQKVGGTPPVDAGELTYLATDTKSPYVAHFSGSQAGQTAHYWLRWVNSRGEPGPWSETLSVTISG